MASILAIGGVCGPDSTTNVRAAWLALCTVPTSLPSQRLLADGQPRHRTSHLLLSPDLRPNERVGCVREARGGVGRRRGGQSGDGNITTSAYLHDGASRLEVTSREFGSQARFIDVQTPTEVFATAIDERQGIGATELDGAGHRMPIKAYLPAARFPVVVEQYQHLPILSLVDASGRARTGSER
ncbi:hypothetical protein B0H19DRAFT_1253468 [Mycena capillaripes]|nr:hypothetical protein B0H19DRAFT_1253468 [Mycena capillaripes]